MKAEPPKRKRRWFQFSLRTLLFFVTGMAIVCGWYAAQLRHASGDDALIDAAQKIEGRIEVAYSGPDWIPFIYPRRLRRQLIGLSFDLSNDECRREDVLLCLAGFRELQWLDLGPISIDEEELQYVGRLEQLLRLTSTNSSITETGAAQLARLPNLQELNLSGCHIDNATIRKLADCPRLEKLMLRGAVAADELVDLGRLRGLTMLDLSGCDFRSSFAKDEAAKLSHWLNGLEKLEELYLRDCPIESGDIESISRLKNLRILDLTGHTVSASDLRLLSKLPELRQLGLDPTSINEESTQLLQKLSQLELLWVNEGDFWIYRHDGPFESQVAMLQRASPSFRIDTAMPSYPGMRCNSGTRVISVSDLIDGKEETQSAGGGAF